MKPRVRLADVAAEAGVSLTTASLILNERATSIPVDTRQRVWDAIARLGYHPHASARALVTGRTNRLGIVFNEPDSFGAEDNYYAVILAGIVKRVVRHDRNLLLHTAHYGDWRILSSGILGGAADGAILVGRMAQDELACALLDAEFPTVCVSYSIAHPRCVSVDCDNEQGGYLAVRHLLALGHRRIAILYPGENQSWGAERYQGARRAVQEMGLDESVLSLYNWAVLPLSTTAWTSRVVQTMVSTGSLPTAFVCCDEARAVRLLDALAAAGLQVPGDCSVISFNSTEMSAHAQPPMTSVWQPLRLLGETAVDVLVSLIEKGTIPTSPPRIAMQLDVRASCGPPPASVG